MHETILGVLGATATITALGAVLARPARALERALVAAAYGVTPDRLTRNPDGVLVVTTATRKAIR